MFGPMMGRPPMGGQTGGGAAPAGGQPPGLAGLLGRMPANAQAMQRNPLMQMGMGMMRGGTPQQGIQGGMDAMQRMMPPGLGSLQGVSPQQGLQMLQMLQQRGFRPPPQLQQMQQNPFLGRLLGLG